MNSGSAEEAGEGHRASQRQTGPAHEAQRASGMRPARQPGHQPCPQPGRGWGHVRLLSPRGWQGGQCRAEGTGGPCRQSGVTLCARVCACVCVPECVCCDRQGPAPAWAGLWGHEAFPSFVTACPPHPLFCQRETVFNKSVKGGVFLKPFHSPSKKSGGSGKQPGGSYPPPSVPRAQATFPRKGRGDCGVCGLSRGWGRGWRGCGVSV